MSFLDNERRKLFVAYFNGPPLKGDRKKLMEITDLSKGRVSQLLDAKKSFGERVAIDLAEKLGLQPHSFLLSSDTPWPFSIAYERVAALSDRHIGGIETLIRQELARIDAEEMASSLPNKEQRKQAGAA